MDLLSPSYFPTGAAATSAALPLQHQQLQDDTGAGGAAAGGGGGGGTSESVRRAQAVMERFRFALQSFDLSARRQEQVGAVGVLGVGPKRRRWIHV